MYIVYILIYTHTNTFNTTCVYAHMYMCVCSNLIAQTDHHHLCTYVVIYTTYTGLKVKHESI